MPKAPQETEAERRRRIYEEVDEQSRESFPASDSPSFTPVTGTGPPSTAKKSDGQTKAGVRAS